MKTAALLLAAGHSRRFGAANKLLAPLNGRPLVSHTAETLRRLRLDHLVACVRDPVVGRLLEDFELCFLPDAEPDQSASVAHGIKRCADLGADRTLIALADMPFVSTVHLKGVIDQCVPVQGSATVCAGKVMPPACFPRAQYDELQKLSGDRGAAFILRSLPAQALVEAEAREIADIDTPDDIPRASGTT
ncbi:MAG: nucleotidyltransferase family protein [Pseudomonadota bacterium]